MRARLYNRPFAFITRLGCDRGAPLGRLTCTRVDAAAAVQPSTYFLPILLVVKPDVVPDFCGNMSFIHGTFSVLSFH
jgi:hypothetical protein